MNSSVVTTEPTSTMNITGLRIMIFGLSLPTAATDAVLMINRSKIDTNFLVHTFGGRAWCVASASTAASCDQRAGNDAYGDMCSSHLKSP